MGDLQQAAAKIEERVEEAEEAAEQAAIQNQQNQPEPQPDHTQDLDLGQRIGKLEQRLEQPFTDSRVDDLLGKFDTMTSRLEEALQDSVAEVDEVTPDVEETAGNVMEPVEAAPKRVNRFLKRLW